jgi:hypothetical protein
MHTVNVKDVFMTHASVQTTRAAPADDKDRSQLCNVANAAEEG